MDIKNQAKKTKKASTEWIQGHNELLMAHANASFDKEKQLIEQRDGIIDGMNVPPIEKDWMKAFYPSDYFEGFPNLVKSILIKANKGNKAVECTHFLMMLGAEVDKILLASEKSIGDYALLEECYNNKSRLLEIAKKVQAETYLLPGTFDKIIMELDCKKKGAAQNSNPKKLGLNQNYIFDPQQYGKKLNITELMRFCNTNETKLRRFIKSKQNIELGHPISNPMRGRFYIKSCFKNKLPDLVKSK